MDDIQNTTSGQPDYAELQSRQCCLQRQIITLLVLLLAVSVTFSIFLQRQFRYVQTDLNQARQMKENLEKEKTGLRTFLGKLAEYSKTHPDFTPILNKHGITLVNQPPPGTAAPTTPPKK